MKNTQVNWSATNNTVGFLSATELFIIVYSEIFVTQERISCQQGGLEKVSVIVPVYNAAMYVKECVASILGQSYQNIEVLLIDDYSSDNSLQILNGFAHHVNVRVLRNTQNLGSGPTRNVGLQESSGTFICFVDADDWIDKGYIEGLVRTVEKTDADLVVTSYCSVNGQQVKTRKVSKMLVLGMEIYPVAILNPYRNSMPSVWARIYRKQIIDQGKVSFPSARTGQDYEFNLKYMFECQRVSFVPLARYYYYRKEVHKSITVSFRFDYIQGYSHLIETVLSHKRNSAGFVALRKLRGYELYTSCLRKILQSDLSDREKALAFSEVHKQISPWSALERRHYSHLFLCRDSEWIIS